MNFSTSLPKIVRVRHQFGPDLKIENGFRLFLDDARNPPLDERGWVVVRRVETAIDLVLDYGLYITEVSLDNDLGTFLQGYDFLQWILDSKNYLPRLKKIVIHTGNDPKARLMRKMLLGNPLKVKRVIPSERLYLSSTKDKRTVIPYRRS